MTKLVFEKESYRVIGACIKVHKNLGNGFSEAVYHEALMKELGEGKIPFEQHKKLPIYYNKSELISFYVADFLCFDKIMLKINTEKSIDPSAKYQIINNLRHTNIKIALLINFGEAKLTWKRFINTHQN
jgi:GxxExxY protein